MRALPAGAHGGARLATDSCAQADYFMVCGSDAPVRRWVSLCTAKRCCTLREATRTPRSGRAHAGSRSMERTVIEPTRRVFHVKRDRQHPPVARSTRSWQLRRTSSARSRESSAVMHLSDSTPSTLGTDENQGAQRGETTSPTLAGGRGRHARVDVHVHVPLPAACPSVSGRSSVSVYRRMFHVKPDRRHGAGHGAL